MTVRAVSSTVEWLREHVRLAVVGYVVLALATTVSLGWLVARRAEACVDRKHQWTALHSVIIESYSAQSPSPALLDAFPQLKPFYTPGNPLYEATVRAANDRRQAVLDKLGPKPSC
jgi:hypothetical protein